VKLSKCTIAERVQWIVDNTHRIARVASHPMADVWWTEADDPLQFFAFCCEWAQFAALFRQGKGAEYVCALPVAMDGTCNGLQHFAAMLRDEQGAAAVNVTPQERPEDIYQRIMDEVTGMLERGLLMNRWPACGSRVDCSTGS
jgi:DNA-directed RNA polymerase